LQELPAKHAHNTTPMLTAVLFRCCPIFVTQTLISQKAAKSIYITGMVL